MNKKLIFLSFNVLWVLVLIQIVFMKYSLFNYLPYTGYILHLMGGCAVSVIVYSIYPLKIDNLPFFLQSIVLSGSVALAAIAWEIAEYIMSPSKTHLMNQNVYAVLEDLVVGVLGAGIVLVWVRLKPEKIQTKSQKVNN